MRPCRGLSELSGRGGALILLVCAAVWEEAFLTALQEQTLS